MVNDTKLREELKECVEAIPALLPQSDCDILILRYGLNGSPGLGIVATGKELEMSAEMVHATEMRAISYLSSQGHLVSYGRELN
jgi:DNA-directed RNA polymerase sigma subunit (sigma70/sigma32)